MATVTRQSGLMDRALGVFFDTLTRVMHSASVENERAWRGTVAIEAGGNGGWYGQTREGLTPPQERPDPYGHYRDGKVVEIPMNEYGGLERNQEVRASLEPSKQEARFSERYGPEHYAEAAPYIQPDRETHQAWTRNEVSPLMGDLRQEREAQGEERMRLAWAGLHPRRGSIAPAADIEPSDLYGTAPASPERGPNPYDFGSQEVPSHEVGQEQELGVER